MAPKYGMRVGCSKLVVIDNQGPRVGLEYQPLFMYGNVMFGTTNAVEDGISCCTYIHLSLTPNSIMVFIDHRVDKFN